MMLGDFDFEQMNVIAPGFATIYFILYEVSLFIILLNIVIALLNGAFQEVTSNLKHRQLWKRTAISVTVQLWKYMVYYQRRIVQRCCLTTKGAFGGGWG